MHCYTYDCLNAWVHFLVVFRINSNLLWLSNFEGIGYRYYLHYNENQAVWHSFEWVHWWWWSLTLHSSLVPFIWRNIVDIFLHLILNYADNSILFSSHFWEVAFCCVHCIDCCKKKAFYHICLGNADFITSALILFSYLFVIVIQNVHSSCHCHREHWNGTLDFGMLYVKNKYGITCLCDFSPLFIIIIFWCWCWSESLWWHPQEIWMWCIVNCSYAVLAIEYKPVTR